MTYKWEAMVEDLTVERDRLRKALEKIFVRSTILADTNFEDTKRDLFHVNELARSALKETT